MLVELLSFLLSQPFHKSFNDDLKVSFRPFRIFSVVDGAAIRQDILFVYLVEIFRDESGDRGERVQIFALSYWCDVFRAELINERKNKLLVFWRGVKLVDMLFCCLNFFYKRVCHVVSQ